MIIIIDITFQNSCLKRTDRVEITYRDLETE